MKIEKNSRFLMTGDSITDAGHARENPANLFEALGRGYVCYTAALLGAVYPQLNIEVVNRGISGNTVIDLQQRWQKDALDIKPDWMSCMIGINDLHRKHAHPDEPDKHIDLSLFESTYRKLLSQIRPSLKGLILLTPFYIELDRGNPKRADTDAYCAVVRKLTDEFDAIFVDTQAIMDKALQHLTLDKLGGDRVHPTPAGHMLLARGVLAALDFQW